MHSGTAERSIRSDPAAPAGRSNRSGPRHGGVLDHMPAVDTTARTPDTPATIGARLGGTLNREG
jgi:hypothetical protein